MSVEQASHRGGHLGVLFGLFAALVLLYSLLVANRPLFGTSIVVLLYAVSLLRRSVRATERIADALERREA